MASRASSARYLRSSSPSASVSASAPRSPSNSGSAVGSTAGGSGGSRGHPELLVDPLASGVSRGVLLRRAGGSARPGVGDENGLLDDNMSASDATLPLDKRASGSKCVSAQQRRQTSCSSAYSSAKSARGRACRQRKHTLACRSGRLPEGLVQ